MTSGADTPEPADAAAAPETAPEQVFAEAMAALETERQKLKDELLRALAESENVRRRAERAVEDERKYGAAKFARDMLGVADNLRRALQAGTEAAKTDPAAAAILEGVTLTEKELLGALERHGVRKLDPKGERFNPHLHQAIAEVPGTGQVSGTIIEVVQQGYMIHDRILRPAMVAVARGDAVQPASGPAQPPGAHIDTKA